MSDQAPPQPSDDQGGDPAAALNDLGSKLSQINDAIQQSDAPDDGKQALQAAVDALAQAVAALSGGGPQAPAQVSTPEQGGNPNARPMTMAGR